MKTTPYIRPIVGAAFLGAALLTGCGDDDDSPAGGSDTVDSSANGGNGSGNGGPAELKESEHPLKEIGITGNDQMKFNVETLDARPGQPLEITFENVGTMPKASMGHNWVLLERDVDPMKFTEAGFASAGNEYINPDDEDKVLAKTAILGPGESETVTFNAPSAPGEYAYVCTFPGHFAAGMKGVLVVE